MNFRLETRAGFHILVWNHGSCRPASAPEVELWRQNERLREALRKLVKRLEFVHADPAYQSVWHIAQIHHCPYQGPKYADELEAAKQALEVGDDV